MDILTDKQYKNYESLSRYSTFPIYYNTEDDKFMYGLTNWLSKEDNYVLHTVQEEDTPEFLSYKYYGRPDYYWVILDYNRIVDSFIELYGNIETLKIPTISSLKFEA